MTQVNWLETPARLYLMLKEAGAEVFELRKSLMGLPLAVREKVAKVYYQPDEKYAHAIFHDHDEEAWDAVGDAVRPVCPLVLTDSLMPAGFRDSPWIVVKSGAILETPAKAINMRETPLNRLFGGPSPLAAMLSGGVIGAGLGYGGGALAEQLLPEQYFQKGRLRKTLAVLGGAAGAVPGAAWGASAMQSNPEAPGPAALIHGWPFRDRDIEQKVASVSEASEALRKLAGVKAAWDSPSGAAGLDPIPVDAFNQVVWGDPRTPLDVRAATTGLTESASVLSGSEMVNPLDIGRIAVGMGTGWASGMLVGKTLGALAGLRPESQQKLQQTGMWAGILANVVPIAFRRM